MYNMNDENTRYMLGPNNTIHPVVMKESENGNVGFEINESIIQPQFMTEELCMAYRARRTTDHQMIVYCYIVSINNVLYFVAIDGFCNIFSFKKRYLTKSDLLVHGISDLCDEFISWILLKPYCCFIARRVDHFELHGQVSIGPYWEKHMKSKLIEMSDYSIPMVNANVGDFLNPLNRDVTDAVIDDFEDYHESIIRYFKGSAQRFSEIYEKDISGFKILKSMGIAPYGRSCNKNEYYLYKRSRLSMADGFSIPFNGVLSKRCRYLLDENHESISVGACYTRETEIEPSMRDERKIIFIYDISDTGITILNSSLHEEEISFEEFNISDYTEIDFEEYVEILDWKS